MPNRTNLPPDADIVRLHDEENLSFPAIGARYGLRDGRSVRYAYLRHTGQLDGSGRREYGNRAQRRAAARSSFAGGTARTFGVEIECDRLQYTPCREALAEAGVPVANTRSYTHEVIRGQWKVVTDATVSGCEAVTPPLSGQAGIDQIRDGMRAMRAAGASVGRNCGMHVHVSMDGLNGAEIAQLVDDFATAQPIVDSFVPGSRRSNRGGYSGGAINPTPRFREALRTLVDQGQRSWHGDRNAAVRSNLARTWGHDRYSTLNFDAFRAYGTVEFRQHAGTLNAKKAAAWVEMLVTFVEASQTGTLRTTSVEAFLDSLVANGLSTSARNYLLRRAEVLGVASGTVLAEPEPEPVVTVEPTADFAASCRYCAAAHPAARI